MRRVLLKAILTSLMTELYLATWNKRSLHFLQFSAIEVGIENGLLPDTVFKATEAVISRLHASMAT